MAIELGGVLDTKELDAMLKELGERAGDLRPLWFRIDSDVSRLLREQFATGGRALGTPWAPLNPVTVQLRVNQRMTTGRSRRAALSAPGAGTPLRDTGAMWSSFTNPNAPQALRSIKPLEYVRGSRYGVDGVPVAMLHQRGFWSTHKPVLGDTATSAAWFVRRRTPVKVPARPIIPRRLPRPVLATWEGYVRLYLEQGKVR